MSYKKFKTSSVYGPLGTFASETSNSLRLRVELKHLDCTLEPLDSESASERYFENDKATCLSSGLQRNYCILHVVGHITAYRTQSQRSNRLNCIPLLVGPAAPFVPTLTRHSTIAADQPPGFMLALGV